jgi:hypothetical protein
MDMAKSKSNKVREWRKKMISQGGKFISVCLKPDVAEMFEALQQHRGKSRRGTVTPLIVDAIKKLYESTPTR